MTTDDGAMVVRRRARYASTPGNAKNPPAPEGTGGLVSSAVAAARAGRLEGEIVVGPRSRGETRVGEAAHPRLTYRPELDAIRGVAVLLVLVQHFGLVGTGAEHGRAGQIGVTLFFVLSGYLITGLLLAEWAVTGTVSLRRFYVRRIRRLAPALLFMVAVSSVFGLPGQPLVALTYTGNVYQWLGFTDLGAYVHTWTLAIEEQFYLVWPAAFLLLAGRRAFVPVIVAVIVVSAVAWPVTGILERSDALLGGALLAVSRRRFPAWAGVIGWGTVLALGLSPGVVTAPLLVLAAAASIAVVGSSTLAARPLVWLGTISYAVYLWSYPIAVLVPTSTIYWGPTLFGIALTIAMAVISTKYVEARWRIRHATASDRAQVAPALAPAQSAS